MKITKKSYTTKTANEKNFVNPAHGDIPVNSITSLRKDHYDDKVEGMESAALSTTSASCIGIMSDSITGFCD